MSADFFSTFLQLGAGILLIVLVCIALQALTTDLWQLPYVVLQRPVLGALVTGGTCLCITVLTASILGTTKLSTLLFAAAAFSPWFSLHLIAYLAWRLSPNEREAAARIRNEMAVRLDEKQVDPSRYWRTFVIDLERARRHAAYEPPPI